MPTNALIFHVYWRVEGVNVPCVQNKKALDIIRKLAVKSGNRGSRGAPLPIAGKVKALKNR